MFFYGISCCDVGFENRDIMVHLQRLLSIEIEISNIVYCNDRFHYVINHIVPFIVHLQLLYEKF